MLGQHLGQRQRIWRGFRREVTLLPVPPTHECEAPELKTPDGTTASLTIRFTVYCTIHNSSPRLSEDQKHLACRQGTVNKKVRSFYCCTRHTALKLGPGWKLEFSAHQFYTMKTFLKQSRKNTESNLALKLRTNGGNSRLYLKKATTDYRASSLPFFLFQQLNKQTNKQINK